MIRAREASKFGFFKSVVLLFCLSLFHNSYATDAQWTGSDSSDLNTSSNWIGGVVPTGIAIFDSAYPGVRSNCEAEALFTVDSFYFPHQASFSFIFDVPEGALEFTGEGITGSNTNTSIYLTNEMTATSGTNTLNTAQFYFNPSPEVVSASIGDASFSLLNESSGAISFQNAAQFSLADSDVHLVVPVTGGDHINLNIDNRGLIEGSNEAAQLFSKGASFSLGDGCFVTFYNQNSGAITSFSDTGQIVFDADYENASFTLGNGVTFFLSNGNNDLGATISSQNNNVGQLVFDGMHGSSVLTVGDDAIVTLIHKTESIISNTSSGNDAGQMVFDGNSGTAGFVAGDNVNINMSILTGSSIEGLGFDTGQIVIDGDGGVASFTVGDDANIVLTCFSSAENTILSGEDGNDAGQIVIDGNDGQASFTTGKNAFIYLSNAGGSEIISQSGSAGHDAGQIVVDGYKTSTSEPEGSASFTLGESSTLYMINAVGCSITSSYNTGQLVVDGNQGSASVTLGSGAVFTAQNKGAIVNTQAGAITAQILFDGSNADAGGVSLHGGNNSFMTAILGVHGTISNAGTAPEALMYFDSATITGSPTLTAINRTNESVEGIVFVGDTTASRTNIALQNSTFLLDVTGHEVFTIGSLAGDNTSSVKLNQDLEIHTASGKTTSFFGTIFDDSGINNLIVSGSGTQILSGTNTYGGTTTVNGGNLVLNGSVAHAVVVNSGGTFSGTGLAQGNVFINDAGILAPGTTLGTLRTNQNYFPTSNAKFLAHITGALDELGLPKSSLFVVDGTATLAGELEIASIDGTYSIGRPYTILTAGVLRGTFNSVVSPSPFLNIGVTYYRDPSVELLLSTDFVAGAKTSNQRHVAEQIDGITVPVGNEEVMINNLLALSSDTLPNALDQMEGEPYCYMAGLNQFSDFRFNRRIFNNIRDMLDPCFCACSGDIDAWILYEFGYGHLKNSDAAYGYKEHPSNVSLGANVVDDCMMYGAAVNLESNRVQFSINGSNTLNNVQGALYGAYTSSDFYVFSDLIVGQGYSHFKRHVAYADLVETAHATPRFTHGLFYAEVGVPFEWCSILAQPFFGADCGYVNLHGFHEYEAKALDLWLKSRSVWSGDIYLGSHFTASWECLQFNLDLAYQRRLGNLGTTIHPEFISFGDNFSVRGASYSRDGFLGNLNAVVAVMNCLDFYLEFTTEVWSHQYAYFGALGLDYVW